MGGQVFRDDGLRALSKFNVWFPRSEWPFDSKLNAGERSNLWWVRFDNGDPTDGPFETEREASLAQAVRL